MPKKRLDHLLVERGLVESRAQAQRLIMAGQVRVNGQMALKPAVGVPETAEVEIDQGPPFVSRGGEKLAAALQAFQLSLAGLICADVGASTGGFTDCLLQNGAVRVYAIDVGKGILHWKLRQDPRVVVMEETNARYVESLPEKVQLVAIDASFISLRVLLPVVKPWLGSPPDNSNRVGHEIAEGGDIVALIKPQFEAGRAEAARGDGVIRDPEVHRQVLRTVLEFANQQGLQIKGLIRSPLLGPKGNAEFLVWLTGPEPGDLHISSDEIEAWLAGVT
jgi:23S rRNA (cytidine1920-2'-O)/16S rRNA (cytidine1409-2'-O)-methyltransferase